MLGWSNVSVADSARLVLILDAAADWSWWRRRRQAQARADACADACADCCPYGRAAVSSSAICTAPDDGA